MILKYKVTDTEGKIKFLISGVSGVNVDFGGAGSDYSNSGGIFENNMSYMISNAESFSNTIVSRVRKEHWLFKIYRVRE
jgi:hypothetical protein